MNAQLKRLLKAPAYRVYRRALLSVNNGSRSELLQEMPKNAICAEIGVWKGAFSEAILAMTQPAQLHLVDPWAFADSHPRRLYGGVGARNQYDMDAIASDVRAKFAADSRVVIHRITSQEFFATCEPESFYWVYIDGDHSASAVLADLRGAWRAVRPSGIIAGDDYFWRDDEGSLGVRRGVRQFSRETAAPFRRLGSQFIFAKPAA